MGDRHVAHIYTCMYRDTRVSEANESFASVSSLDRVTWEGEGREEEGLAF